VKEIPEMRNSSVQAVAMRHDRKNEVSSPLQRPESEVTDEQNADLIEADLLIEDVSIDGMCGVY
jgi:mycofactocin precursor